MSRRWPGSFGDDDAGGAGAPARGGRAPATTSGWVLMTVPGSYSTMFGLSSTRLPRDIDTEFREAAEHDVRQIHGVRRGGKQADRGR